MRNLALTMIVVSALAAGCAGPRRARQSAKTLAIYTTMVKTNLEDFSRKRTALVKARIAAVNSLEESALQSETETGLRQKVWRLAGDNAASDLFDGVLGAADFAGSQETSFLVLQTSHAQALQQAKSATAVPSKKLEETAKGLATLAEKSSLKTQLEFIQRFAEEVKADIDTASQEADGAVKTATSESKSKARTEAPPKD